MENDKHGVRSFLWDKNRSGDPGAGDGNTFGKNNGGWFLVPERHRTDNLLLNGERFIPAGVQFQYALEDCVHFQLLNKIRVRPLNGTNAQSVVPPELGWINKKSLHDAQGKASLTHLVS
jgi:hypothetical protein